ncbi:MBOAT family O-acyltransferase [Rhodovibrionaceae bacterium A322]
MLFNTDEFIFLFLPIVLAGFFLLGRLGAHRACLLWLVAASLFYYGWWNPLYIILVGGSMMFNYTLGSYIGLSNKQDQRQQAKMLTTIGVVANLGLLGYYKYANFFLENLDAVVGQNWTLGEIILPVGISFFTFQQIAYLVDAYKGETKDYDFVQYSLFVMFFPQLIAGPIVHHKEMLPQFARAHTYKPRWSNVAIGSTIFAIGLGKKMLLADPLATVATPVFVAAGNGEELAFFEAWKGSIAYGLQLYFDFSGYSDMAIGLARMFGIRLPLNFNSPYKATGIIDFWRRWHMTLSRFLRDYIYIPLGGSRKGLSRRYINLMATMVLGGLWHGAGWSFMLWGFLHGFFLIVNHGWRYLMGKPSTNPWAIFCARFITFVVVILAWVPFRAENMTDTMTVYRGMMNLPENFSAVLAPLGWLGFTFNGPTAGGDELWLVAILIFWLSFVWLLPNTQDLLARFRPAYHFDSSKLDKARLSFLLKSPFVAYWRPQIVWGILVGLILGLSLMSLNQVSEFLYYQF